MGSGNGERLATYETIAFLVLEIGCLVRARQDSDTDQDGEDTCHIEGLSVAS